MVRVMMQMRPPEVEIETPEWMEWIEVLGPLAALPLWAQAAILSAGVAVLFFVVPAVARWIWHPGEGHGDEQS